DRGLHWAEQAPERTRAARRVQGGDWRRLTYCEALHNARCIAQALIDLRLSAERPVAILSDNDLEHLQLALGCMLAGVPYAPISAAYSLLSQDYGKLRHILDNLTPGLVFAASASAYGKAINATVGVDTPLMLTQGEIDGRESISFDRLLATPPSPQVDAAHAAVGPDTIAKFLFTSGSTKSPKGVINTQRMLCSNQQMILQCFPTLAEEPPVLVDWLPWNHTFGGNHNVGLTIYNGGTLYIDDGKPTPALIGETLRNLREIAPTVYFNVPMGDKTELRYRGPNVTPGYWRASALTAECFDADGFYCSGDAVRLIDAKRPQLGYAFDGRIAEDFKLATGTFVSVGPLRARAIAAG